MSLKPGDLIGEKYFIIRKLGQGSFGIIYQGKHFLKSNDYS